MKIEYDENQGLLCLTSETPYDHFLLGRLSVIMESPVSRVGKIADCEPISTRLAVDRNRLIELAAGVKR